MRRSFTASIALLPPLAVLAASPKTVVLEVQNMTCSVCPITVKKSLQKVPGVAEAKITSRRRRRPSPSIRTGRPTPC